MMVLNRLKHHIIFDIDGTLIQSYEFDSRCFVKTIREVMGLDIDDDWSKYKNVTDTGILFEIMRDKGIEDKDHKIEEVKKHFVKNIREHLNENPAREVSGANSFLSYLKSRKDIVVSFATGGWRESALLKLDSAGIDYHDIPITTADKHYCRTEILKIANTRVQDIEDIAVTYFGDGPWDKVACQELGFDFILVGNKISHNRNIIDFRSHDKVFSYIFS